MNVENGFVFDYWPTGSCDMVCDFCYGAQIPVKTQTVTIDGINKQQKLYLPSSETIAVTGSDELRPEMGFQQAKEILSKMHAVGGNTITVAGGEPLIREETPALIDFAKKSLSMTVYLSSDGTYVQRRYGEFASNIDILGLPLDGSNAIHNAEMGRRLYLYKNIRSLLSFFNSSPPAHILKVGTVVSRINYQDIHNIGNFLFRTENQYSPDVWRLYQFESIGRGKEHSQDYRISNDEFETLVSSVEAEFPEANVRPRSNETHLNAYFFITPDGMLQVVDQDHHLSIADLLSSSEEKLGNVIGEYTETVNRANANRNWLNPDTQVIL